MTHKDFATIECLSLRDEAEQDTITVYVIGPKGGTLNILPLSIEQAEKAIERLTVAVARLRENAKG